MPDLATPAGWLPLAFLAVMGLAMLAYVILDGYDLGVGLLLPLAGDTDKDTMVASIGPFWDANETWLVLGIGVLLVAFPLAHGVILGALYLPVALMLVGLILRGVSFDFRIKARAAHKGRWNRLFAAGSALAALSQGYMLGRYVTGFEHSFAAQAFAALIALCLAAGYVLLGANWLILKTEGELQRRAVAWARRALWGAAAGIAAVSIATPLVSARVFARWFTLPEFALLLPVPLATLALLLAIGRSLARLPARLERGDESGIARPFACSIGLYLLAFCGLAYSSFPYLVVDRIDVWQAASAPESLMIVFIGTAIVLPVIIAYTVFAYRIFGGKARPLDYG